MRTFILTTAALAACVMCPLTAAAQVHPREGSQAIGFEVGTYVPNEGALEPGLLLSGLFEHYVTPRVSVRAIAGWHRNGFERESVDAQRQGSIRADVNYNWERGAWHPFVGAGVGAYFIRTLDNGQAFGDTETTPGVSVGGGIEYFLSNTLTLKGEGRYHGISRPDGFFSPSGWALTVGMKKYF
jgi:opacity protein-like surface antigen